MPQRQPMKFLGWERRVVLPNRFELLVMGCTLLSKSRMFVATELDKRKAEKAVEFFCSLTLLWKAKITAVKFLTEDGHFLANPRLAEASPLQLRWKKDATAMLDQSVKVLRRQIAEPFEMLSGLPMELISARTILGDALIEEAWEMSQSNPDLAHQGGVLGLERILPAMARANVAISLAVAMYMAQHRESAVFADCQVYPRSWDNLLPYLKKNIWGAGLPCIGITPGDVRQPWTY